jgi:anti-sigma factor RsiW
MAELPAPPSLLDEVNPRLVVAVTRSQKRKREEEQALVSVSSLFGAPSFSPAGARCSLWTGTGFARAENNNA